MEIKDYYKILELEPSATQQEIKKAYRKLAQHFHPDKNSDDQYAELHFAEIKEAYEVLTDPSKKQYYLQKRWYQQSLGKTKFKTRALTPPVILKQFLELDQYVSTLDGFRMDQTGLYHHVEEILDDDSIGLLKKFNETDINREIVRIVLNLSKYFSQYQVEQLAGRLKKLAEQQETLCAEINAFVKSARKKNKWEEYKAGMLILITIIISLLIYFTSR